MSNRASMSLADALLGTFDRLEKAMYLPPDDRADDRAQERAEMAREDAECRSRMELRERFESEARSHSDLVLLMDGDFYVDRDTEIAWRWFCAGADLC